MDEIRQRARIDQAELLGRSFRAFFDNFWALVGGYILAGLTAGLIVTIPSVHAGYVNQGLRAVRGQSVTIGDAFSGYRRFGTAFLALVILMIAVFGGLLLLVIPGIIAAVGLYWTYFALMDDRGLSAGECLGRSWELFKANKGHTLITILLVFVLWLGIGILSALLGAIPMLLLPETSAMIAGTTLQLVVQFGFSPLPIVYSAAVYDAMARPPRIPELSEPETPPQAPPVPTA